MSELTVRQQAVLDCIVASIKENGMPPTLREIGKSLNIVSTNGVNDHLRALERMGYIERDKAISRGIRVVGVGVPSADEFDRLRREAAMYRSAFLQVAPKCVACKSVATVGIVSGADSLTIGDPRCDAHYARGVGRHSRLPWADAVRASERMGALR